MSTQFPVSQNSRISPVYASAAGQTVFACGFPAQNADDIEVYNVDDITAPVLFALNVDYSVSTLAPAVDATVTFGVGRVVNEKIRIRGRSTLQRLSDITSSGKFRSAPTEADLDRGVLIAQENRTELSRALKLSVGSVAVAPVFSDPVADRLLVISSDGKKVDMGTDLATFDADVLAVATNAAAVVTNAAAAATSAGASETAKTASVVAQTASENARDLSVTAKNLSVTAQTASEVARDAAIAASETLAWGYTFDTGTTDADPGAAKFRFDNATFGSATFMYISETADEGSLAAVMDVWDDSTSTVKATVQVRNPLIPSQWFEFYITGALVDSGTYRKVPIQPIASNGTMLNAAGVLLAVKRNGDLGTGLVDSFNGRTGAITPASGDYTKSQVGLANVDNTSDAGKPISTATQTALDGKLTANATPMTEQANSVWEAGTTATPSIVAPDAIAAAIAALAGGGLDAGMLGLFAMITAPAGWLKANGAAVSRTTYANLFAAISTTWGVGDGSTTFNVPDFRGQFVRGWVDDGSVDSGRTFAAGQAEGYKSHTHTQTNLAAQFVGTGENASGATGTGGPATGSSGGSETRPVNETALVCIKY